jgi:Na+-driven multidrug efflux pump
LEEKSRTKRALYNVIASLTSLLLNSLTSFLLVRVILLKMGSDYNGLNSTVAQFLAILLIFENSFTNASQVALYKPFKENDHDKISKICATTKKVFNICGICLLVFGLVFAAIYSNFVKIII